MKDKNGVTLNVGDWVNFKRGYAVRDVGRIKEIYSLMDHRNYAMIDVPISDTPNSPGPITFPHRYEYEIRKITEEEAMLLLLICD